MISKERLEELIEQGVTIYEVKYGNINPVSLKNKIRYVNYKYETITFEPRPDEKYLHHKYFKRLFETKEEAEWFAKFGNISRTETLSLPTWEELNNCIKTKCFGNHTIANFDSFVFEYKRTKTKTVLEVNRDSETKFYDNLTKENYFSACELCRKLFLGEEL